jgi:hypothetical protein
MNAGVTVVLVLVTCSCTEQGPRMKFQVTIPEEYRQAYQSFWYNCIAVRAADLKARCPFVAGGTPAASGGARDGSLAAETCIDRLLQNFSERVVRDYLGSVASQPEAIEKMRPYFGSTPRQ